MKITDLLKLKRQQARQLVRATQGATELPASPTTAKQPVFSEAQRQRAQQLYTQAEERGLISGGPGIEDWRLQLEIIEELKERTPAESEETLQDAANQEDVVLLARLLGLLPKQRSKKRGTGVKVEGQVVTLSINTGQREYVFTFPQSNFEE